MKLAVLPYDLTMCVVERIEDIETDDTFTYVARVPDGHEVICVTQEAPANTIRRADGWKGITVRGLPEGQREEEVDKISQTLGGSGITHLTEKKCEFDLILVDEKKLNTTIDVLSSSGYVVRQ